MKWNLHLDVSLRGHHESSGLDSDNTRDFYIKFRLGQNPGRDGTN